MTGAKGAFTGESSCDMLKSAGCTYDHWSPERRGLLPRDRRGSEQEGQGPFAAGLVPVFLLRLSPFEVREAGTYVEHVVNQVKAGLDGLEITSP